MWPWHWPRHNTDWGQGCKGRHTSHFNVSSPTHKHLHVSRIITVESSPLHVASSRTGTWYFWHTSSTQVVHLSTKLHRPNEYMCAHHMLEKCQACHNLTLFERHYNVHWTPMNVKVKCATYIIHIYISNMLGLPLSFKKDLEFTKVI